MFESLKFTLLNYFINFLVFLLLLDATSVRCRACKCLDGKVSCYLLVRNDKL